MTKERKEVPSAAPDAEARDREIERLREALRAAREDQRSLEQHHAMRVGELKETIRGRDEFLAIAAHELRNPMSALVLAVETLRITARRMDPTVSGPMLRGLEIMQRNINHFVKRATTLLDLSRINLGELHLDIEDVDLIAIIRQVAESSAGELAASRSTLKITMPASVIGRWDRVRLEQIITNLLSNAIKYGAGNPIHVRVRARQSQVAMFVRDGGVGIAPNDQVRIFRRFERAGDPRMHGGFGVGLWVVRQIAQAMGGRVGLKSRVGRGSCFRVVLPRNSDRGIQ